MDNENKKTISRRGFLKTMGAAGLATAGLTACVGPDKKSSGSADMEMSGEMTCRTNPSTGDKVSLLGFGMMRLPSTGGRSAREGNEEIDQEMVNEMVDYALAHGVNYFDTSPAYCLLPRQVRARHRHCPEPPPTGFVFHSHQTLQLRSLHMDTRGIHRHVPQLPERTPDRPYRLSAAARCRHGQRNGGGVQVTAGCSRPDDAVRLHPVQRLQVLHALPFIPAILLHYNKCLNEGNIPESSQDAGYRRARRAYLIGYDRSVPRLRQASHCIGCNQCTPHCPQSIRIPEELHRIDRFVEQLKQGTL